MLDFINQNAGILTLIFAAMVAISTVVYAFLTASLARETRRMRQVQTEPKIEITIRPHEECIDILHVYVRNIGLGPAFNITFEVDAETKSEGAQSLIRDFTESNFFKTGLKYLAPGQEITGGFSDTRGELFEEKINSLLIFKVSYRGAGGNFVDEEILLNLLEFKGRGRLGKLPLYDIASNIKMIQADIRKLSTGFRHLLVDIYTSDDRERIREEREKARKQTSKTSINNDQSPNDN